MSIGFRMVTTVARPDPRLVARFEGLHSCDISDVTRESGTMVGIPPIFRPIRPAVGTAVTASIPSGGVNFLKLAMAQTIPGDILVVSARGNVTSAVWGANLTRGLLHRGVRGLIVDGAVRDAAEIREDGLPVFARGIAAGICPLETSAGEINLPIACGGIVVNPGDIVVADEDGIAVIPPDEAEFVLGATRQLMDRHEAAQPVLLRGGVTQIDEISTIFAAAGLESIARRGGSAIGREDRVG